MADEGCSLSPTTLTIVSAGAVAKNQVPLAETELKKAPTLDALFITYLKKRPQGVPDLSWQES